MYNHIYHSTSQINDVQSYLSQYITDIWCTITSITVHHRSMMYNHIYHSTSQIHDVQSYLSQIHDVQSYLSQIHDVQSYLSQYITDLWCTIISITVHHRSMMYNHFYHSTSQIHDVQSYLSQYITDLWCTIISITVQVQNIEEQKNQPNIINVMYIYWRKTIPRDPTAKFETEEWTGSRWDVTFAKEAYKLLSTSCSQLS